MLGPSGEGKTHIALALCQRAVMAGHKCHCRMNTPQYGRLNFPQFES
jgi:DNA replication protein DnaC